MRIMHLSDLHLGKKVHEYSMLEDQRYILDQILEIAEDQADAVMICGDVYDKSVPPVEAVSLCDQFLESLADREIPVLLISGNHDSAERLEFGSGLMSKSGVYIASAFDGKAKKVTLLDEYGPVHFYLLPFIKPSHVRHFYPDEKIESYQDAVRFVLDQIDLDANERNVILAHQNVTGAVRTESEEINIGGLDNIDASLFDAFDYAALGHIHRPQNLKAGTRVRYCGTPLKYSFSEADHQKSVTMVTLDDKGEVSFEEIPLTPVRDLRKIKGTYDQVMSKDFYQDTNVEDYLQVILTDEEDIPDAMRKLRTVYPNILRLEYDNVRTRENQEIQGTDVNEKSPLELVEEFYHLQNNQDLNQDQEKYLTEKIKSIWEVE